MIGKFLKAGIVNEDNIGASGLHIGLLRTVILSAYYV